jgi:hypothetical protein
MTPQGLEIHQISFYYDKNNKTARLKEDVADTELKSN